MMAPGYLKIMKTYSLKSSHSPSYQNPSLQLKKEEEIIYSLKNGQLCNLFSY